MIWALILRYQIAAPPTSSASSSDKSSAKSTESSKKRINAKKLLLNWVNASLPTHNITNFSGNWNDGVALSALVDYCKPGLIPDHATLNPDNRLDNIKNAMDLAEKELGIPQLMQPEDLAVDKPDDLSVMTYVSGFCRPGSSGQQSLLEWVNSKIPNHPVSNFTTDWTDGKALGALVDSLTQGGFPECEQMKDDNFTNCQEGIDAAETLLGVKKTTTPDEFMDNAMDQLTRSTYITHLRNAKPSPNASLASTLKAVGPGITGASAERETTFVVRGPRIPKWAKLEATVKGTDGTEVPLKQGDTSSKASQFHYTPEVPGNYVVDVTLNSEPIPGSLFKVTHLPPTNVDGCVATGSGLSKARVGETAGFSVNCEEGGPGELQVDIESPNGSVPTETEEPTEKVYSVSFVPEETGNHAIHVLWDNKNVPSSPFACTVTDPKKCSVTRSGLGQSFVGQPETVTVKAGQAGPGELSVEVDGPNGSVPAKIKEKGGNVFDITYVPKETGPHNLNIKWADDPISGSPFPVDVLEPADASRCTVSNLPTGNLRANREYSFDVNASNAGTGEIKSSVDGPGYCTVKDSGNGLYTVNFTPTELGDLKVDVSYGDESIPQGPFKFRVNDPDKVVVDTDAGGQSFVGQPQTITVKADQAGPGELSVEVDGPNGSVPAEIKEKGGSVFDITYIPKESGPHNLNIKWDDDPISGSPFPVDVLEPADASKCTVSNLPTGNLRANREYSFDVNASNAGTGEIKSSVDGPGYCTVKDSGNGLYTVNFTPTELGDLKVDVSYGDESIPQGPFKFRVNDPDKVVVDTDAGGQSFVGQPQTITVKADQAGPGELSVEVDGPNGSVPAAIKEKGGSVFDITYIPKESGPHNLNIKWDDDLIPGSPFPVDVLEPADASKCTVSNLPTGKLRANKDYSFNVYTSTAGVGELKASADGPTAPASCNVEENKNGPSVVNFTPAEVGTLDVDVLYGDEPVGQSPFKFIVNDPTKVKVDKDTIESASYFTKEPVEFIVSTEEAGEGDVAASVQNSSGREEVDVKDKGSKSYLLSYSPKNGGSHDINITFDGCEIPNVPINISVDDSSRADSVIVSQPLPSEIGAYVIRTPYNYKVNTENAGQNELTATSLGTSTGLIPAVNITKHRDGQFSVSVAADEPDEYVVKIQWGGDNVPGSPFKINIEDNPHPEKVVCTGPEYTVGSTNPVTLDVDATNAGAGKPSATCHGQKDENVPVKIVEQEPKKYLISFNPPSNDIYSLDVMWDSSSVKNSPFSVNLIPPDASKCIIIGPEVPLEHGEPIVVHVDASNAGNGKIAASALGDKTGEKDVKIRETEANFFVISFIPNVTDVYTLDVTWGGDNVPHAPFRVSNSGANADKVMICEPPTAMLEAGQAIGICFDTSQVSDGILTATCKGNSIGEIPIQVTRRPKANDKYDVIFLPPEPDIFVVNVLWTGVDVKGSPFTINLMPVDVSKIKVIGPNMPLGPTGPAELMLQTAGAGKGKVTGTCVGKNAGQVEVVIKETSTDVYELCFIPPEPDMYDFKVQYGGQSLKGSPFLINTLPADASLVKVKEPDSIDLSKLLTYKVDTSKAGSGALITICQGEKSGHIQLNTVSEVAGYYNVSFMPTQSDLYKVAMKWDGKEVTGSPFRIDLRPPMAERVKVGDLHVPEVAGPGEHVWLDIDCSNAGHGPLKSEAKGKASGKMPIEAERLSRAKYRMKFPSATPDIYTFAVAYGNNQVLGSPFKINLLPPQADKVVHTHTTLPELEGGPVSMYFDTTEAGNGKMTADISNQSTDSITKKVDKTSSKEHKLTFIPDIPDIYDVYIKWSGSDINDSPFKVDTRPPLHPELIECGRPIYSDINLPVNVWLDTSRAGPGRITAKCSNPADGTDLPVNIQRPNSKYNVSFTPKYHGNYNISIFFEGDEIKDSPLPVNLNPISEIADMMMLQSVEESIFIPDEFLSSPTEEDEAEEEEEGEEKKEIVLTAFIGTPLTMSVSADDEDQKNAHLHATASGTDTGPLKVDVTKNEDGTFDVYFNPTIPDRYYIDVSLDDDPVPNSPFVIDYVNPIDPSKCRIFGLQNIPAVPQVSEPIDFGVDAKDAGDGKLSVTSDGPSLEDQPSYLEVKDSEKGEPGIYNITFVPTTLGEHKVHLLWAGKVIPRAPLVFDICDVRKMQRFPYGKPVSMEMSSDSTKAGDFEAHAIHEDSGTKFKVKVSKDKKGKFKLGFQPKQPGIYAIHVLRKKSEVPGSPFRIRYLEPTNPLGVVISDFSGNGCVDCPITFSINAEKAGTGELSVKVEGPNEIKDSDLTYASSPESKELSYNVSYTPRHPGDHKFHIVWAGKPIPSSPLKADVTVVKPELKTVLHSKATNVVEVNQPVYVKVINAGPNFSVESITADCKGDVSGSNTDVQIQKEEEDFNIQFKPEVADDYTLKINLENLPIDDNVFEIKAIEKDVLSPNYVHPGGSQPSDVLAGKPVNISCRAPDLEDPSDLVVKVEGPYGPCPPTIMTDSNGSVGIGFLPPFSGDYIVQGEKDGSNLPSSFPCKIRARGKDPDASKVGIMGEDRAIFDGPIPFGKPARFRISTVDAGPGTLNITSKGPGKAKVKVFDNKDGTYTCDFTPKLAGKYHIDILWNKDHISGSPYMLEFKSKKNRVIAGLNLEDEDFRIDIPHQFKLHCGGVGEGILEIITRPPSAAAVRLIPLATGKNSYQCEITPKEPGNHEIRVQYNGKHVFGSPFNVQFDPRGDASKCQMIESFVSGQDTDNENVSFLVSTAGAGRGKLTSSVEQTSSKEKLPVTVTPLPDDKFKVEFHPKEGEGYLLSVKFDNKDISGSPFKLMFGGDSADASQCTAEGEGLQACIVDREAQFVVKTLKPNDGELSVSITGEKGPITPKLSPVGSTTTTVSYVAQEIGKYDICIKWANEDITNSPFQIECFNPSDPSRLMVDPPPSEVPLGSPLQFTIKAVIGSLIEGSLTVTAQSSNNKSIIGSVEESEHDPSYTCTFNDLTEIGKYFIHARWEGAHIKNSPFKVRVVNPPNPSKIKAYGPGLENSYIGQEGNFTVETGAGGSGTMAIRVHGPKGAFKINMRRHPDNDRTILVRYDPTHTGKYNIDVTWSEVHIPGSPFAVEFKSQ